MNKIKVATSILALGLGAFVAPASWADAHIAVQPAKLKWNDAPSVGPGAKIAILEGDLKAGPYVFRLMVPANFKIAPHTHPLTERYTVVSGTLYFATGDKFDGKTAKAYGPGTYVSIPKGTPMYAFTKDKPATIQLHGSEPWGLEYVDPQDDPRKKK